MAQPLAPSRQTRLRDSRHGGPPAPVERRGAGARDLGIAGLGALLIALASPAGLPAQSRGSLQVAARVVAVAPHRDALAGVGRLVDRADSQSAGPLAARTRLAELRVATLPATGALPPRRVVTVSFTRN